MNFHTVKVWLSKLISNLVLMLFIILVPAVASGAVPFWAAVIVAAAGLAGLNAACGVLLENQPNARPKAAPTPAPQRQQLVFRVVRGGRAACSRVPSVYPGAYNRQSPCAPARGDCCFPQPMLQ